MIATRLLVLFAMALVWTGVAPARAAEPRSFGEIVALAWQAHGARVGDLFGGLFERRHHAHQFALPPDSG